MSRPRDFQIWWVVAFAGVFWALIWQHQFVLKVWQTAANAAIALTSGMRAGSVSSPAPAADPKSLPASKVGPKRQPSPADRDPQ